MVTKKPRPKPGLRKTIKSRNLQCRQALKPKRSTEAVVFFQFHKGTIKKPPKTGAKIRIKTVRTKKLTVLLTNIQKTILLWQNGLECGNRKTCALPICLYIAKDVDDFISAVKWFDL